MYRLVFLLLACLAPLAADAGCKGRDLRNFLTDQGRRQIAREVAATPYAQGLHWAAQKGDQTIHVIGTMHSGDRRMGAMMNAFAPYVRAADLVILEIREREIAPQWKAIVKSPQSLMLKRGPFVSQLMRPELWTEVALKMQLRGVAPEVINRIQPWFLSEFVVQIDCDPYGWNRSKGLDGRIERLARNRRIPMMSLETVAEALAAQSAQPVRDQVRLLELNMTSTLNYADHVTTTRNGYFTDTLYEAMLASDATIYSDIRVSRSEVRRLLNSRSKYLVDRRNRTWMPRILARKEKTIVVAVGAAHLPGKAGVLNLLRAKGYKLTRIPLN